MMINRVIKRIHIRARPTLTRGNKSYSDSTMETSTSDQNSIPSNSIRQSSSQTINDDDENNAGAAATTCSDNQNNSNSQSDEFVSEDDTNTSTASSSRTKQSLPQSSFVVATATTASRTTVVSFACDYGTKQPHDVMTFQNDDDTDDAEAIDYLSDEEVLKSFYTTSELNSFDRDRALTVLMHQTRNKSIPWDDNVHSIRGLEEYTSNDGCHSHSSTNSSGGETSRRSSRKEFIQLVLNEQNRLRDTVEGRMEVRCACKCYTNSSKNRLSPQELIRELLRGVSCSGSKLDKQRAIQIAHKDEREVNAYQQRCQKDTSSTLSFFATTTTPNSRRRYLSMVKNKINDWSNTSNKSISSTGTCGDRSTTSDVSFGNNNHIGKESQHQRLNTMKNDFVVVPNDDDDDRGISSAMNSNTTTTTTTKRQPPQQRQQPPFTSPLSIIQQVVYETSREFDCDHTHQ